MNEKNEKQTNIINKSKLIDGEFTGPEKTKRKDAIQRTHDSRLQLFLQDVFGLEDMQPLISPKTFPICKTSNDFYIKIVRLFLSENINKKITEEQCLRVLKPNNSYTLSTNVRNYLLGTEKSKEKQNYSLFNKKIEEFDNHLEKSLKNYNIDEIALHYYLEHIKDIFLPNENKKFSFINDVYCAYLEKSLYVKLLVRIFLSLATVQHFSDIGDGNRVPSNTNRKVKNEGEQHRNRGYFFLNGSTPVKYLECLHKIWYDKEEILALMEHYAKEKNIEKINSFYENKPDFLNLDFQKPNYTPKNNDIEFWYRYIISLKNAGDYKKFFNELNTVAGLEEWSYKCEYADAVFSLYECYSGTYSKYGINKDSSYAKKLKERAKELGYSNFVFDEIKILYNSSSLNYKPIKNLLSYIDCRVERESVNLEQIMSHSQLSEYFFYNGFCFEKDNIDEIAQNFYEESLKFGNEAARQKLIKKNRKTVEYEKTFQLKENKNICIINSSNDNTKTLLRTLSHDFAVFSTNCDFEKTKINGIKNFNNIKECIDETLILSDLTSKKIIIALLGDDETENLNQCLEILDRLFNAALEKRKDELNKFIDIFDIYVRCNYDYASTFIDASISDMGEKIYFSTHIVDPYRSSLQKLLYNRPLFLPCLDGEKDINIAVCGYDNNFNLSASKEIMAVGYIGDSHNVNVSLYSKNHIALKEMIKTNLPGLENSKQKKLTGIINPTTVKTYFSEYDLLRELDKNKKINYIIVNVGTDTENISFAVKLRRYLLVHSSNLERKSFIAVYCRDSKTAFLANRMTLGNVNSEECCYYNNYELYFFGTTDSLYTYEGLVNNTLEKQALAIHLSYCDLLPDAKHNIETHNAFNSYYSYKYNQDSSLNVAICLRYRLYMAGCYDNSSSKRQFSLEDDFEHAIVYEKRLDQKFFEIEQIRWNNFMISRGWSTPTSEQLAAYLNKPEIINHQYRLAKLHPYIANWDDLDDDGAICKEIKNAHNIKFKSPQGSTKSNVKDTAKFLHLLKKMNELEKER